ncbi:MAG: porphobilinogen synthase [Planctomycetota bacterium]|jgi:porphobilinogen synthase
MDMDIRPRRARRTKRIRDLFAEVRLVPSDLIQGHFIMEGEGQAVPIQSMPGIERQTIDRLLTQVKSDVDLGIHTVLLFGVPGQDVPKDGKGSLAYKGEPLVSRAVKALKDQHGDDLVVITDVCLCAYTDHGHCGILEAGEVLNDESLPSLAAMALSHARAGADIVAPSDMMDGRVAAIRERLDEEGFSNTGILSYAAKFASGYYGPFREAADSAPGKGDRKAYQMDPRSGGQAIRDALLDEDEGADMLMVKPALAYLDLIRDLKEETDLPVACYNVSGEYSLVHFAAQQGLVDLEAVAMENLIAMRRAGADKIITYHAREALANGWLR